MNISNLRAWLTIALVATPTISSATPVTNAPIGRLFFTPQERSQLDVIRHSGLDLLRPTDISAPDAATTVTLSGVLQRRHGGLRAWVNGMALDSEQFDLPVRTGRELTAQQQLPMRLPGGATVRPKVGQVINLSTGELNEGYQRSAESQAQTTTTIDRDEATAEDTPSDPGAN